MGKGRLAALVMALLPSLAQADVELAGPVEYGVFVTQQIHDPQPGERILSRVNQRIEQANQVPARLGTKFGVRYKLSGKGTSTQPLTLLYLTPGLIGPDGKRQDKIELSQKLVVGAEHDVMAYEFSDTYELVPGQWRFMVFQGERKLLEQEFSVH